MQFAISFPKRFTFHYVSIKTQKTELLTSYQLNLHSTMYLLKLFQRNHINHWLLYLHSTMYLLKLQVSFLIAKSLLDLHSTMYLLKLIYAVFIVYIIIYLHSTMYLLKPSAILKVLGLKLIYIPLCIY